MSRASLPTDEEIFTPFLWMLGSFTQELGPTISATSIAVLTLIALYPGVTQKRLCELSHLSKFAVSRACRTLASCTMIRVEHEGRDSHARLTPRGQRFIDGLTAGTRHRVKQVRAAGLRRRPAPRRFHVKRLRSRY